MENKLKDYLGNVLEIGDKCIRCASLNSTEFSRCEVKGFYKKVYHRIDKEEILVEILSEGMSKIGRTYPQRLIKLDNFENRRYKN